MTKTSSGRIVGEMLGASLNSMARKLQAVGAWNQVHAETTQRLPDPF